jgi:hypothetical protein
MKELLFIRPDETGQKLKKGKYQPQASPKMDKSPRIYVWERSAV